MSIEFSNLPYAIDALEPHISARTLEFHHGKHHKAYVDKSQFKAAALGQFGSGWTWLVKAGDRLDIISTGNAYVDAFLNALIGWEFAARNFADE